MLIDPRTAKTLHDVHRTDLAAHGPRRRSAGTRVALAQLLVALAGRLAPPAPAPGPRAAPEAAIAPLTGTRLAA